MLSGTHRLKTKISEGTLSRFKIPSLKSTKLKPQGRFAHWNKTLIQPKNKMLNWKRSSRNTSKPFMHKMLIFKNCPSTSKTFLMKTLCWKIKSRKLKLTSYANMKVKSIQDNRLMIRTFLDLVGKIKNWEKDSCSSNRKWKKLSEN